MWPLAIVGIVFVYFLQIFSGHVQREERIQGGRLSADVVAKFSIYSTMSNEAVVGQNVNGNVRQADMMRAAQALNLAWVVPERWCERAADLTCWWGSYSDGDKIFIYRKDLAPQADGEASLLLLKAFSALMLNSDAPTHVGFVKKGQLVLPGGRPSASPAITVPAEVPQGALVKMMDSGA
jgi:hypothetical protein